MATRPSRSRPTTPGPRSGEQRRTRRMDEDELPPAARQRAARATTRRLDDSPAPRRPAPSSTVERSNARMGRGSSRREAVPSRSRLPVIGGGVLLLLSLALAMALPAWQRSRLLTALDEAADAPQADNAARAWALQMRSNPRAAAQPLFEGRGTTAARLALARILAQPLATSALLRDQGLDQAQQTAALMLLAEQVVALDNAARDSIQLPTLPSWLLAEEHELAGAAWTLLAQCPHLAADDALEQALAQAADSEIPATRRTAAARAAAALLDEGSVGRLLELLRGPAGAKLEAAEDMGTALARHVRERHLNAVLDLARDADPGRRSLALVALRGPGMTTARSGQRERLMEHLAAICREPSATHERVIGPLLELAGLMSAAELSEALIELGSRLADDEAAAEELAMLLGSVLLRHRERGETVALALAEGLAAPATRDSAARAIAQAGSREHARLRLLLRACVDQAEHAGARAAARHLISTGFGRSELAEVSTGAEALRSFARRDEENHQRLNAIRQWINTHAEARVSLGNERLLQLRTECDGHSAALEAMRGANLPLGSHRGEIEELLQALSRVRYSLIKAHQGGG